MRGLFDDALRLVPVVAAVAVLFAACSAGVAPSVSPAPMTSATAAPAGSVEPTPLAAWRLDANGDGSPGEPLTFVGIYEFDRGAVVLDGLTAFGATPGAGPLDTTASFTVAAWVTVSEDLTFSSVLSQVGETAAAFYLGVGEEDWAFSMKDLDLNAPGHTIRARGPQPVIDPAAWVHIAGVFDQPAGQIRLYLDGERAAETSFDAPWQAGGPMAIGGSKANGGPADFWPGAIDAAIVYQAALTDDEIGQLRDASRPTTIPPVLAPIDPAALEVFRGTWDYEVTDADPSELREWMADVAAEAGEPGAAVTIRYGFDHDRYWIGFVLDGELWLLHGVPEGDGGVMTVDGDTLTMTNGTDGWMTYRWAIDGERLTLDLVDCVDQARSGACIDKDLVDLLTSRTVTRSGTDPTY